VFFALISLWFSFFIQLFSVSLSLSLSLLLCAHVSLFFNMFAVAVACLFRKSSKTIQLVRERTTTACAVAAE